MSCKPFVTLLVLVVALATAKQAARVTMFNGPMCNGNTTSYMFDTNTCLQADDKTGKYQSYVLSCPTPLGQCLQFANHAGPTCTNFSDIVTAECNKCLKSKDPNAGTYMFQCFENRGTVEGYAQCNDDCSMCKYSQTMSIGGCATTPAGNFLPLQVSECPRPQCVYFLPDAGANCASPTNRIQSECNKCMSRDDGTFYAMYCNGNDTVFVAAGCNADCSSCSSTYNWKVGTCNMYDHNTKSIYIDRIAGCGGYEYLFTDSNCQSKNATAIAIELDACRNSERATCVEVDDDSKLTASKKKSFKRPTVLVQK